MQVANSWTPVAYNREPRRRLVRSPRTELGGFVSAAELVEFDSTPEARRLLRLERRQLTLDAERQARLEADQELVGTLQFAGFAGDEWDALATALVEYGYTVIAAWIRSGKIIEKCHEKRLRGIPQLGSYQLTKGEAQEVAGLVLMAAIQSFRDNILVAHKWDYRRGASLRTYFVGHCVIVFIDVYERWRVEEVGQPNDARRLRDFALDPSRVAAARASTPMPGDALTRDESLFALLAQSGPPSTQRVMYLFGEGYTQRQTAEVLDMSEKAVESHRYRGSEQLREVANG